MVRRLSKYGLVAVICVAPALLAASSTAAAGRARVCKTILSVPHWHIGFGDLHRTRRSARRSAIRFWVRYTALEYGAAWARFGRARRKSVTCLRVPGAGRWWCTVSAQPCRR